MSGSAVSMNIKRIFEEPARNLAGLSKFERREEKRKEKREKEKEGIVRDILFGL